MYLVECYNDGTVLLTLGVPRQQVKRQYGKGKVIRAIQDTTRKDLTCMMDLDRNKTGMQGLPAMQVLEKKDGLELYEWRGHRGILGYDFLEDWWVRQVRGSKRQMSDFGLPDTAAAVHRLERTESDPRLVRVVQHLVEVRAPGILTLRRFLRIGT